jgi:hypothetical protein
MTAPVNSSLPQPNHESAEIAAVVWGALPSSLPDGLTVDRSEKATVKPPEAMDSLLILASRPCEGRSACLERI